MAIGITDLGSGYDNTDGTSYVGASLSPAANSLLMFPYSTRHGSTGCTGTVSGLGLTWIKTVTEQVDGLSTLGCWHAQCSASPGSGALTLSIDAGITAIGASATILQVTGHNTTTPIVTTYQAAIGLTGATGTITFSALANSGNAQLASFMHRGNTASTPKAGWTAAADGFNNAPNHGCRSEWKIGAFDASATMTWTSARWQGLGVEIAVAGGAPATPKLYVPITHRNHLGQMAGRA